MSVVCALKLDLVELWQSERTAWSVCGQLLELWQCLFNDTCVKCKLCIYYIEYFNSVCSTFSCTILFYFIVLLINTKVFFLIPFFLPSKPSEIMQMDK